MTLNSVLCRQPSCDVWLHAFPWALCDNKDQLSGTFRIGVCRRRYGGVRANVKNITLSLRSCGEQL